MAGDVMASFNLLTNGAAPFYSLIMLNTTLQSWSSRFLTQWMDAIRPSAPMIEPPPPGAHPDLDALASGQKYYFDIVLYTGQCIFGLEEAFKVAGFDPDRARWQEGNFSIGVSFHADIDGRTPLAHLYPQEAAQLRQQGYETIISLRMYARHMAAVPTDLITVNP